MNAPLRVNLPPAGVVDLRGHDTLPLYAQVYFGSPVHYFMDPVVTVVNYLRAQYAYTSISMVGLSGGGWATTLAAALDPRISRSFPVAGSLPLELRTPEERGDWEQAVPELYAIASYLDLYVLG